MQNCSQKVEAAVLELLVLLKKNALLQLTHVAESEEATSKNKGNALPVINKSHAIDKFEVKVDKYWNFVLPWIHC